MSGIAENVNENHILSYLREREIIPTYISIFRSKCRGSLCAKINIPKAVCSSVKGFWPMHVSCKPWKPSNQEKNSVQHRDATTNKGELPSRTQWVMKCQLEFLIAA